MVADQTFGQLFITDSHLDRTEQFLSGLSEEVKRFGVVNGTVGEL